MALIGKDLEKAIFRLMQDDVVAIPTETVYGLAGNALSEKAIQKIFEVKNRPLSDPLIVHLPSIDSIDLYVSELPDLARQLFKAFSPGPLTILLPKSHLISDLVTNGSPMVAIRIPNHPLTLNLLRELPFPLVAPSANPFGHLSPTLPEHVEASLGSKISYILDGGPCRIGLESTIIQLINGKEIKVLRQGGVSEESLQSMAQLTNDENLQTEVSPGSSLSHYAPAIPLKLGTVSSVLEKFKPEVVGYLGFDAFSTQLPMENQRILSAKSDINEAARNLFSSLHQLDQMPIQVIVASIFPNEGIGKAINDRLTRAAAKRS